MRGHRRARPVRRCPGGARRDGSPGDGCAGRQPGGLAAYPSLARLVERGLHLLGGDAGRDLRAAIVSPARQVGLIIEPGLVDLLLRDVEDEPGALPLLSHALLETWKRREGNTLTVDGYRDSGAIRGAVAQSAERVYAGIDPGQQQLLRHVLLRLVTYGGAGEPVRSRVPRRLLGADPQIDSLVDALVTARLVSSDAGVLEVSHEALARAWPRLHAWLEDDVEGQRIRHHLTAAADAWDSMGRPDSELYRGVRLARALEWRSGRGALVTDTEAAFLDASQEAVRSEERSAEERAHQQMRMIRRLRDCPRGGWRAASAHHGSRDLRRAPDPQGRDRRRRRETRRRGRAGTSRRRPRTSRARPQRVAAPRRTRRAPGRLARDPDEPARGNGPRVTPGAVSPGRRRLPGSHDGKRGRGADRRARRQGGRPPVRRGDRWSAAQLRHLGRSVPRTAGVRGGVVQPAGRVPGRGHQSRASGASARSSHPGGDRARLGNARRRQPNPRDRPRLQRERQVPRGGDSAQPGRSGVRAGGPLLRGGLGSQASGPATRRHAHGGHPAGHGAQPGRANGLHVPPAHCVRRGDRSGSVVDGARVLAGARRQPERQLLASEIHDEETPRPSPAPSGLPMRAPERRSGSCAATRTSPTTFASRGTAADSPPSLRTASSSCGTCRQARRSSARTRPRRRSSVSFSRDGHRVYTGGDAGILRTWDLYGDQEFLPRTFGLPGATTSSRSARHPTARGWPSPRAARPRARSGSSTPSPGRGPPRESPARFRSAVVARDVASRWSALCRLQRVRRDHRA